MCRVFLFVCMSVFILYSFMFSLFFYFRGRDSSHPPRAEPGPALIKRAGHGSQLCRVVWCVGVPYPVTRRPSEGARVAGWRGFSTPRDAPCDLARLWAVQRHVWLGPEGRAVITFRPFKIRCVSISSVVSKHPFGSPKATRPTASPPVSCTISPCSSS